MAAISLSGAKTVAYQAKRGTLVVGDAVIALQPNTFYEIQTKAAVSALPIGHVSAVFRTPDVSSTAIIPAVGDSVFPLELTRVCKTDADVSLEEGTIDVTDDCEEGFNANILDGYRTISGTLNGFLKFDDLTGKMVDGAKSIFQRFFNVVTDDGLGVYTVTAAKNEKLLLFIQLNKSAALTQTQTWLIVPALINSFGTGAGLKDAQKRDLSWTKAQGYASLYERTIFANDL